MGILTATLVFLTAAIVIVPICKRLGMSSVLGYLVAGLFLGQLEPLAQWDAEGLLHFAEIGVVFLLFVIGLELQPRRLWVMRRLVFGLGSAQVLATTVVTTAILMLLGIEQASALLLGFSLALSSTAFVLQMLGESKRLHHPHGRAAFGTLLLQDVAVIPGLLAIALLGSSAVSHSLSWQSLALLVAGCAAARFLLRPVLRFIAATKVQELFTAAALTLVMGAAVAFQAAGLSMGLGAFLAGMMVADSEYRHQLEADVNPFKGLLLGLFFMAVGMTVDLSLLASAPLTIGALTLGLMAVKAAVLYPLARLHGLQRSEATRTALVLAQGGEFAFVLLTAGVSAGLMADGLADQAVLVVSLSMALTPLLVAFGDQRLREDVDSRPFDAIDQNQPPVVIAGFGRVGQIVARVLAMRHIPFTALEINPHHVDFVRQYGNKIYYGDAAQPEVLRAADVAKARAIVVAVGDIEYSLAIVDQVRRVCPGITILARATNRHHELWLRERGVDFVLRDTLYSSLRLAQDLLQRLGMPEEEAAESVRRFRQHDARTLERQALVWRDAEAYRRTTIDASEALKQLFAEDARSGHDTTDERATRTRERPDEATE
ncbi:cation:proton antiporter [Algiphilus sp. NNCM1]|uniref:cation:proton antiporter domain-containing protein n=1 Tax=Algiphilus sp. TaxID=1872431 RepID=UPI001CA7613F|nr:cation:proton antiporter [Algiphilus sp.]MBY8966231.1 cation:proton antiporter [Algiphilus acroporae]MCI5104591.1 cation:proton antiporter [Algiphilus sp.]